MKKTPAPPRKKNAPRTVERLARVLQARIRQGQWARTGRLPGQRQLALALGVSRASLREAIAMLESLGLLRSEPARGIFITKQGDPEYANVYGRWRYQERYALRDVYLVRSSIEALAAAMAAPVVTQAGLQQLQNTVDSMRAAADRGDLLALAEWDAAFHARIFEFADSPLIQDIAESIADVVASSRQLAFADPQRVREPIDEHARIIAALACANPVQARLAMQVHIRNVADRVGLALRVPGVDESEKDGQ